jgi:hypothetical protein
LGALLPARASTLGAGFKPAIRDGANSNESSGSSPFPIPFPNLSEGAGRRSRADKQRVYGIARGELCEAVASVEIDAAAGGCPPHLVHDVHRVGSRLLALLNGLLR